MNDSNTDYDGAQAARELLSEYALVIEAPIWWGDMDAFEHVNNTVYFRFFEHARIAYFERVGTLETMQATGIGPILASTDCRFRIPLTYPDRVLIGARSEDIREDRFTMRYAVASQQHGKLAAEGSGLIVTFNYKAGTKAPLPAELAERIRAFEQGQ